MNKTELIATVAEKTGLSKKDTEAAVNATLLTITETLKAEEKVQLVGFGSYRSEPPYQGDRGDPRRQGTRFQGRQGSEGRRRGVILLSREPV